MTASGLRGYEGDDGRLSPSIVVSSLRAHLDEPVTVSDLASEIEHLDPSHVPPRTLFLVRRSDRRQVAKTGPVDRLKRELSAIERVAAALADAGRRDVAVPSADLIPVAGSDLGVLLTSCASLQTIDGLGARREATVKQTFTSVLTALSQAAVVWPDAAPRNVVGANPYVVVDWERGVLAPDVAGRDAGFYIRALCLIEEAATVGYGVLPYWHSTWPPVQRLLDPSVTQLRSDVRLADLPGRRWLNAGELLELPDELSDRSFARLVLVFSSLAEGDSTLVPLQYAADQIASATIDISWRTWASALAWHQEWWRRSELPSWLRQLVALARRAACETEPPTRIEHRVNLLIDHAGRDTLGEHWRQLLSGRVKAFVMGGASVPLPSLEPLVTVCPTAGVPD